MPILDQFSSQGNRTKMSTIVIVILIGTLGHMLLLFLLLPARFSHTFLQLNRKVGNATKKSTHNTKITKSQKQTSQAAIYQYNIDQTQTKNTFHHTRVHNHNTYTQTHTNKHSKKKRRSLISIASFDDGHNNICCMCKKIIETNLN
jgi:type III secretory pathway component EscV